MFIGLVVFFFIFWYFLGGVVFFLFWVFFKVFCFDFILLFCGLFFFFFFFQKFHFPTCSRPENFVRISITIPDFIKLLFILDLVAWVFNFTDAHFGFSFHLFYDTNI